MTTEYDDKIEKWSAAFDTLVEAKKRRADAERRSDKAIGAYKKDHQTALDAYNKATEDLDDAEGS